MARKLKQLNSTYMRSVDLINVGAYEAGSNPTLDQAIVKHEKIDQFLQQDILERAGLQQSLSQLADVLQGVNLQ